jgi:hypothetical protein
MRANECIALRLGQIPYPSAVFNPKHFCVVVRDGSVILSEYGRILAPAFEGNVRMRRIVWLSFFYLLFSLAFHAESAAQRSSPPPSPVGNPPATTTSDGDESQRRIAANLVKKGNLARQAQLKIDTDKLLKLSQELKEYVDKSNENVLSLDVLKKAEEIEKLARSVKEKMKGPN